MNIFLGIDQQIPSFRVRVSPTRMREVLWTHQFPWCFEPCVPIDVENGVVMTKSAISPLDDDSLGRRNDLTQSILAGILACTSK